MDSMQPQGTTDVIASGNGGSYLKGLGDSGNALKTSYSPFGSGMPRAAAVTLSTSPPYVPTAALSSQESSWSATETDTDDGPSNNSGENYMHATGDNSPPSKTSYSPFGGGKPTAAASSGWSYQPMTVTSSNEVRHGTESDKASSTGLNYIQALGGNAAPSKASYSPFGSGKPTAASSGMMYVPMAQSPMEEASNSLQDQDVAAAVAQTGPVSTASYMQALGGNAAPSKSSYSPFGTGKPSAASTVMMYEPTVSSPSFSEIYTTAEMPVDDSPSTSKTSSSSLESLGGALGSATASLKASYSPFGGGKPRAAASTGAFQYAPPSASSFSSSREPMDEEMPSSSSMGMNNVDQDTVPSTANAVSYLESMGGGNPSGLKQSYSPFGSGGKGFVSNASLYSAPASAGFEMKGAQAENPQSNGASFDGSSSSSSPSSYLETMNGTGSGSSLKQSYSPFGSKPSSAARDSLYNPPS
jgi:hypothetical protein